MAIPVGFDILLKNHPYHYQIKSLVDGPVAAPSYLHAPCCIQASYALNLSGAPSEKGDYYVPEYARKSRFFPDKSGRLYLIEVCDMGAYLNNRYGIADNYKGTKAQMEEKIAGRKGIIRFGKAHIDLWDGEQFHQDGMRLPDFPVIGVWDAPSVKTLGIFFWEAR